MKIIRSIDFISDKPTAVALGTFDGVHLGHRAVIEAAVRAARAEGLTPAVFTFSELPKNAFLPDGKKIMPLCSLAEKEKLMDSLGAELLLAPRFDERVSTIPAESFVKEVLIGRLHAKHIVCGFDHRFGAKGAGDTELLMRVCREEGAAVTVIPPVSVGGRVVSSTLIRSLLEKGYVEDARELLGHEV